RRSSDLNALAAADVQLSAAVLDVTASKSRSASMILETNPDVPITVTLGATDGTSTASAEVVTITDTTPEFWDTFELTAVGAITWPAGADRARVDVQLDGDAAWVLGDAVAAPAAPALPASVTSADLERVTGIRYVFDTASGLPFSATVPAADWSASAAFTVTLRAGATFPSSVVNTVEATASH